MAAGEGKTQLDALRGMTEVVADTGEIDLIKEYKPTDATTNPSLLSKAARMSEYKSLVEDAVKYGKENGSSAGEQMELCVDRMSVNFGVEILKHIPGYVSTEVDARLSFDEEGSVARAKRIISMYKSAGIEKERVLIKLASTWEGLCAAKRLQAEGIQCNMTLLFNFAQAVGAAEANAHLISPFVGRILDWHKKDRGVDSIPATEDPGVLSVRRIYNYYKKHGISTIVMGASFRTVDEILELAGCDRLTINPKLLGDLKASTKPIDRKLSPDTAKDDDEAPDEKISYTESQFRWELNQDPMATEKLAEGIRKFAEDIEALESYLRENFEMA